METRRLKSVRSDWSNTLLVCGKCSKRLDGGFGPKGRTPLAKALRKHLGLKKGRKGKAGIVEVKCLGVCPRGAVTVVNGAAPGEWMLVKADADLDVIAAGLGLQSDGAAGAARDLV
jgi:predicted metal-binding protein